MHTNKIPILIIGATGHLGELVTRECLKHPNLLVNILIRHRDKKPDLVQQVEHHGGKVIEADVEKPETLKHCTKGIHTVVSCIVGEDKIVVDGQLALLNDAIDNNVQRFVPSDYSLDYQQVPESRHPLSQQRKNFRKQLQSTNIRGLHIHVGWFIETYLWIMNHILDHLDVLGLSGKEKGVPYWEDADQKLDFSTFPDVAKYVAAAVADPKRAGDLYLCTAGELSTNEVAKVYSKVVGQEVSPLRLGSFEDLNKIQSEWKKKYEEKREKGEIGTIRSVNDMAQPEIFWGVALGYHRLVFGGVGKFSMNDVGEFKGVKSLSFEEFLRLNEGQRLKVDVSHDVLSEKLEKLELGVGKTKDVVVGKVEEAVEKMEEAVSYLVKNAKGITEDLKAKLAKLVEHKPKTVTSSYH